MNKKLWKSFLALAMSGAMVFSVGCGDKKNDDGDKNEGKVTTATLEQKTLMYTNVTTSLEEILTGGKAYQLALDVAMTMYEEEMEWDETLQDYVVKNVEQTDATLDGDAYFKLSEESILVDATIFGHADIAEPEEGEFTDIYYALYARDDDLYGGSYAGPQRATQTEIDAIKYVKSSISDIVAGMMGGGGGMDEIDVTDDGALPPDTAMPGATISPELELLIKTLGTKALTNVAGGVSATIVTKQGVTTLAVDVKQEILSVVSVAETLINTIDEETKLKDLFATETLENFYNQYLGTLTAAELENAIKVVMTEMGMEVEGEYAFPVPAPTQGQSGYEYLTDFVANIPMGENEDGTPILLGDTPIGGLKEQITKTFDDIEKALADINALKYSVSVKDNKLCGLSLDIDIKDTVKLDLDVSLMEVTYTFKDVTTLQLYSENNAQ